MSSLQPGPHSIGFFQENSDKPVLTWIEQLSARKRWLLRAAIDEYLTRLGRQVCDEPTLGREVDAGLFEFRIEMPPEELARVTGRFYPPQPPNVPYEDICLRVFCHEGSDGTTVVLLSGYDCGLDPSDEKYKRDLDLARSRLSALASERAQVAL